MDGALEVGQDIEVKLVGVDESLARSGRAPRRCCQSLKAMSSVQNVASVANAAVIVVARGGRRDDRGGDCRGGGGGGGDRRGGPVDLDRR